jgi:hypothetical protein
MDEHGFTVGNSRLTADGFREAQSPWFFTQPNQYILETRLNKIIAPKKNTNPTPDNRFPGWAGPMNDGRLVTDYRAHCETNIQTGYQFASKQFLQHNADKVIQKSRERQVQNSGAGMAYDFRTDVPAQTFVKCSPTMCKIRENVPSGIGMERVEPVPELFGTFAMSQKSMFTPATPSITSRYEGGRNSVRGLF